MKLELFCLGDPLKHPGIWSGTPARMLAEFRAIPELEVSTRNMWGYRLLKKICFSLFHRWEFVIGGTHDPWMNYLYERRMKKLARRSGADWILSVCDNFAPDGLPKDKKYAFYVDCCLFEYFKYLNGSPWWRPRYEAFYLEKEREYHQNADAVFTQNEWTRQCLIDHGVVTPDRVFNVGFGVNLRPYEGEKDYTKEELLIVLRRGTEHYKGLDLLLDAFEMLRKKRPTVSLSVVGTTARPIDGVNYYEGYPRSKTVELFERSTLYVMPALREPNGITYLEGLANKAPIVGLKRFAVPEFSGNGQWGFMAEHEDPAELARVLDDALSDKSRLREMGLSGQRFVMERYNWPQVCRNIADIMRRISEEHRS